MLKKLLITGAAGTLGRMIRTEMGGVAETLRLSDLVPIEDAPEGAEVVTCDLADAEAVDRLVAGCDGVVHLGGISVEKPFGSILQSNIIGLHNLYEAARRHGQPRILFASSNHVVGFHPQDARLGTDAAHKPDGWYGVSKSFGEAVALMYFHKFGQETALVRIGSVTPEPIDRRALATWFAPEDFVSLIACVFRAPRLGCPVIWGASDNDTSWWDNSGARYLGWRPKRNSAEFAKKIAALPMPAADAPVSKWQGGVFTALPIQED
ncbi:NAD-dependent epimerase/dehydratase family protein [Salipiger marinus]|uniref:Uronate dehydrogenase n=1 Tax=Salipiger marinus TaxID=555512 RepID=A0A1G8T842_9RHOB|nr:NAD(P)-dependent oxidoreductase [Salipiger marinus]SDJ37688.1 uronate dehydrogenase [Salipiger marinus]